MGPLIFFDWVLMGATRAGREDADRIRLAESIGAKLGPATALIVLLGLVLVFLRSDDRLWFDRAWIYGAIAIYASIVIVGATLLPPALIKKAIEKIDAGESVAAEHTKLIISAVYNNVSIAVILFLMVAKPGG